MRRYIGIAITCLILSAGCTKTDPASQAAQHNSAEGTPISVTHWTEHSELFTEYPPLVAGKTSRFAVHFTTLRDFKPVRAGRVTVTLSARSGSGSQSFSADAPSRPGIFGVDVRPVAAGEFGMTIRLEDRDVKDSHDLGPVRVFAAPGEVTQAAGGENEPAISFLKEQQWTLDFGTAQVAQQEMRESLIAPGEVRQISGGEALVTASVSGRLEAGSLVPKVGTAVSRERSSPACFRVSRILLIRPAWSSQ